MTGWFVFVAYVAAVNPPRLRPHLSAGAEPAVPRHLFVGTAAVVAAGLVIVVVASNILDGLDITDETWRLAAGVVCVLVAARAIVFPRLGPVPEAAGLGLIPVAFPLLFTPQLASLAVLFGATESFAMAGGGLVTAVIAGSAVGLLRMQRPELWLALTRLLAAVLIVVGTALVIAGIRDV